MISRLSLPTLVLAIAVLIGGADGCSSDPNVEGAKLYINQEQYDDALTNLDNALAEDPNNGEALALKARVLLLKADKTSDSDEQISLINEASETIDRAESVAPENSELADTKLFAWASLINTGNTLLQDADTDPSTIVPLFESANAYAPDSAQGYYGLGLAHLRANNTEASISALEQSWGMSPDPNAAFFLAQAYLSSGRTDDATALLGEAMELYPDNEDLQSLELSATGDVETYEAQVAENPDNAVLRYNFGTLLIEEERYDDAIEQLSEAHRLDPSADAAYNLGVAHFQKAAVIEDEGEGLTLDQQDEYDAIIDRRNVELEEALSAFSEARSMSNESQEPTICNSLFQVYSALGQESDAQEAADCAGIDFENGQ